MKEHGKWTAPKQMPLLTLSEGEGTIKVLRCTTNSLIWKLYSVSVQA